MKSDPAKLALCALAVGCLTAGHALAQQPSAYPDKLVRIIVPFPPGGGPDVFTRLVAEKLAARWKQPVIVENRPGAGGNVGAVQVARAEPDGYTLLSSPPGPLAINGSLFRKLAYDPAKWSPVTILTRQPMVLGARKNLPANTVQELIALAKASPGKLTYGTLGNGSISHLTMALFLSTAGVQLVNVPYQGSSPAATALMGEQVDIVFDNPITYIGPFRSGRIKILAAGSTERLPVLPDIPSFGEAGFANLRPYAWLGVVAPPGTPNEITERISKAMAEALRQPDVQKRLADAVTEAVGSTPSDTSAFLAHESAKWREVIKSAQVTVVD
jgi:tripartite-type tricarboxylate transporter receptor subunit TctC